MKAFSEPMLFRPFSFFFMNPTEWRKGHKQLFIRMDITREKGDYMHSIRTKLVILTICAIIIALGIASLIGVISIKNLGRSDSDQILQMACKTGAMNLESYFQSVESSVETVSSLVQDSLKGIKIEQLGDQVERARNLFGSVAYNTNGVLTYYYRIDPEISDTVKGFWYVNLDGKGFKEHEVTDITQYETDDTTALVWFTVPKATGRGVWLPPYITDNLDVRVISYNVPVYWENRFVGVIGIEIDYETLAHEVENIKLYQHGYAFILDEDSNIIYHPEIDSSLLHGEKIPVNNPDRILGENHIQYRDEGIEKEAVWLPLSNGMKLYVTVPVSEINRGWQSLIWKMLLASLALLGIVSLVMMRFTSHITKPLYDLTNAAKQIEEGNYDINVNYNKNDEVGMLTNTIKTLAEHTKTHIRKLNKQAYVDALTCVRNKAAYADYIQSIQEQMEETDEKIKFAFGVFDCDNLKLINDTYGHDKGDLYLKACCRLICRVFKHSPVFRIGGDEFAVILQNEDYENREELAAKFRAKRTDIGRSAENPWQRANVTMGMAVYDPDNDMAVIDVARRADQDMYEHKRLKKAKQGERI